MTPELSVIIPLRPGSKPRLGSLKKQQTQIEIILAWDKWENANAARNHGVQFARAEYLLFCDDDIDWFDGAIDHMLAFLKAHPDAAYVYGGYTLGENLRCNREFSTPALLRSNYISTMSIIRASCFVPFDRTIERLQDWDLWLTLLENGKTGVYCGKPVFTTAIRDGITQNGKISYDDAVAVIRRKHAKLFTQSI